MAAFLSDSNSYLYNTTIERTFNSFFPVTVTGGILFERIDGRITIIVLEISDIRVDNN